MFHKSVKYKKGNLYHKNCLFNEQLMFVECAKISLTGFFVMLEKQRGTFVFVAAQMKILLKQVVHNARYLTSQSNQNRVNILNLNGP